MVYAGHLDCYQKSNEVIEKFIDIKLSTAQVYRVTDTYGEQIGKEQEAPQRSLPPIKKEETLYVEADGSMIFTKEEGWKEVKLGRLFNSAACIKVNEKPGWIQHSQYLAHLGQSKDFIEQMDSVIESYGSLGNRLVFISDGATWIKNWIEDTFPQAVSILDYYHACEHLHNFAQDHFKDKEACGQWADKQKELLLHSKAATVIRNVKALASHSKEAQNLIAYYTNNKERMDYKKYQQIGCGIIGSGAIESAHRTVIQRRMKLSGQRWSRKGAQNMLHLRTTNMNGQWNKIIELVNINFKRAA